MNSILSYPNRGKWGKSSYRGNCTGHVIKDLLEYYQPKKFVEVFSGGGTGKEVAIDLGIKNSVHLDLNNGWDAMTDEVPTGSDFVFSHPAYWDIVDYSTQRGNFHQNDLSNKMSYDEFICKLDQVCAKIYQSLVNGGRHSMLIGDIRKKGVYYSPIKDLSWIGDLEIHLIKTQHNTVSERKNYHGKFISIAHENLLVFKKNHVWHVPIKRTVTKTFDLRAFEGMTWRDLIQASLEYLGGESDLQSIYEIVADSKKAKNNSHYKEKIRQTLQLHENFEPVQRGIWKLSVA